MLEKPLNKILKLITLYHGYADDVVIRWSSAGLTNRYSLAELINTALNGQKPFLSQRKAIEMFNFDDDDAQVQEEYERIMADMESQGANDQLFNDSNYYGDDVNDSAETLEQASDRA